MSRSEPPVLLLNPPAVDTRVLGKIDYDLTWSPPIGLAQIAAVLEAAGVSVVARDDYYTPWPEVEAALVDLSPDIVGISVFSEQRGATYRLIDFIRNRLPDATIVLGGPHPTFLWHQLITRFGVDACVIGEGEATFLEAVAAIRAGRPLEGVPGLAVPCPEAGARQTARRPGITELDALPLPSFGHFDAVDYHSVPRDWLTHFVHRGRPAAELRYASAVASRGCPFSCTFCSTPDTWGRSWRRLSPGRFVDVLEWMNRDLGYEVIDFADDIFTTNQKWAIEVCEQLVAREVDIVWHACTRVDCVSPELLASMKRAGCLFVSYGIESFARSVLEVLNKRQTRERIQRAVDWTHEAGLETEFLLIVGSPGETDETIHETVRFIEATRPLIVSPSILTIFPGTAIYEAAKARGALSDDYWLGEGPAPYDLREHDLPTLYAWYRVMCELDRSPLRHRMAAVEEVTRS